MPDQNSQGKCFHANTSSIIWIPNRLINVYEMTIYLRLRYPLLSGIVNKKNHALEKLKAFVRIIVV